MTSVVSLLRVQLRALWADKYTMFTLLASGIFAWFGTFAFEGELRGFPPAIALALAPALGISVRGRGIQGANGSAFNGYPAPAIPASRAHRTVATAMLLAGILSISAALWGLVGLGAAVGASPRFTDVLSGLCLLVGGGAWGAASMRYGAGRRAWVDLAVPLGLGATGLLVWPAAQVATGATYLLVALLLPQHERATIQVAPSALGAPPRQAALALLAMHPISSLAWIGGLAVAAALAAPWLPPAWADPLRACVVIGTSLAALFVPQLPGPARPDPTELAGTAAVRWLPVSTRRAWLQLLLGRILLVEGAMLLTWSLLGGATGPVFVSPAQAVRGLLILPAAATCASIAGALLPLAPSRAGRPAGLLGLALWMFSPYWAWRADLDNGGMAALAALATLYAAGLALWTWRALPGGRTRLSATRPPRASSRPPSPP